MGELAELVELTVGGRAQSGSADPSPERQRETCTPVARTTGSQSGRAIAHDDLESRSVGGPSLAAPDAVAEPTPAEGTIVRRLKVLHDVIRPKEEARGVPFEYVLEISSRCNLVCPMCPREISPSVGNRDMDMDTFHCVLDRIRSSASFVWFAGLGEPMMNKHFMRMIRKCHDAGIATGASTNGTFLTETQRERLLDSPLDLLIVSFDGADKETYEKIRVGADFDKVCENVRQLARRKAERRSKKPWLILQMIELSHTSGQAKVFRRMWDLPGIDSVRIKKDELQFDESLAVPAQRKRRGDSPCPYLWRGTALIQWDGALSPCCYGSADKSFGNVADTPIEKLWNSQRVQGIRRSHLQGRGLSEPFCKNCNTYQPGKTVTAASVLTPSLVQKKRCDMAETLNRWVSILD